MKSSVTSFDKILRAHSSVNSSRFYVPKVKGRDDKGGKGSEHMAHVAQQRQEGDSKLQSNS